MKYGFNQFRPGLLVMLGVFALAGGCKKDNEPTSGLSAKIQNIVPQATLDDLEAKGLVVNQGSQPPNIEGVFEISPYRLLSPYGPNDNFRQGRVIGNYKYRFYQQQGDVVQVDYKNASGSETGTGKGALLAGSGNKFTLFLETAGTDSGISFKALDVVSGEIGPDGILNFQIGLTMTQKTGDDKNTRLIPINQARIWEDGDQLAKKVTTY
ncbi:hypothetical protein [Larkinella punicea]|uniref:Lipoprotein n=1 Tax=Larkinella punicea TaxID=2315727 RepID=A0A368JGM8_9BACT|nr:hypothetical protein [Larkinella punicea]RCR66226.1 hypothetical protein DUE52_28145 [Larkinella punicea]